MWQIISIKLILKVVPVLFLTVFFIFFSLVSDNLTYTLLYSTIYNNYRTFIVRFANSSIVSFDFLRIVWSLIFVFFCPPTIQWNTICWVALGSASKSFCLLKSTAVIICNNLYNMHNPINNQLYDHHHTLLILSWFHHTVLLSH